MAKARCQKPLDVHRAWGDPAHKPIPPVSSTEVQRKPGFVSKRRPQQWVNVPLAQDPLATSPKVVSDAWCACSRESLALWE